MRKTLTIILLLTILPLGGIIHAQDDVSPVVTATVAVDRANIRWMPEAYFDKFTDIDSRIGELHAGDRLTVLQWESVNSQYVNNQTWVYVTHAESGLTGWMRVDLLNIESATWQRDLPVIRTWSELGAFVAETAPNGLQARVSGGNGGYPSVSIRAEPYVGSQKIGEIISGSSVTVLGRALSNDLPLPYVYVRDNVTGAEGWVIDEGIWAIGTFSEGRNAGLPVIYDVSPLEDTAGLPRITVEGFNLRDAPGLDARIRRFVRGTEFYAATGRNTAGDWINVTDLSSGEVGWIAALLLPEGTLDINSLPVVE